MRKASRPTSDGVCKMQHAWGSFMNSHHHNRQSIDHPINHRIRSDTAGITPCFAQSIFALGPVIFFLLAGACVHAQPSLLHVFKHLLAHRHTKAYDVVHP